MTIVNTLDRIAEWLAERVCATVDLKPRSFDQQTDQFNYELVHPAVFPLYVPPHKDRPPNVKATSPAICVQLIEGNDAVRQQERTTRYRLSFSVWDPGIHGPDVFTPTDADSSTFGKVYERGEAGTFKLTYTGWRDVWNFVDVALRAIETDRTLGGYPLDPASPITWGVYDEDGAIPDYHPFWFAWAEVTTKTQVIVANPAIDDLL